MERSAESPIGNMPIEAPTGPVIPELSDQPCSNFGMADQKYSDHRRSPKERSLAMEITYEAQKSDLSKNSEVPKWRGAESLKSFLSLAFPFLSFLACLRLYLKVPALSSSFIAKP